MRVLLIGHAGQFRRFTQHKAHGFGLFEQVAPVAVKFQLIAEQDHRVLHILRVCGEFPDVRLVEGAVAGFGVVGGRQAGMVDIIAGGRDPEIIQLAFDMAQPGIVAGNLPPGAAVRDQIEVAGPGKGIIDIARGRGWPDRS